MISAFTTQETIHPDPEMIAAFARVTLHSLHGWTAARAFPEKGAPDHAPRLTFHPTDDGITDKLVEDAATAAERGLALFVVPGTVGAQGSAKAADVVGMKSVIVDLDHGDIQGKRNHLVAAFGEASLDVASGGVTENGEPRRHLYWSLSPAIGTDAVQRLCAIRRVIANKIGGDPSFRSPHQPIRLPGSVYRKGGTERLVTVLSETSTTYDVGYFEERALAMPALDGVSTAVLAMPNRRVSKVFIKHVREAGVDGVTRFDALSTIIGYWVRRHHDRLVSWDRAWEEIVSYNQACVSPPWPIDRLEAETDRLRQRDLVARQTGTDLLRDENGEVAALPNSQDGLAESFSAAHADGWRFVAPWGHWLTWTGARWEPDKRNGVRHLIRLVCRAHAAACQKPGMASASAVSGVESLARADPRHAADADGWDRDPWMLNTPAGLLDLSDGTVSEPSPETAVTKITAATPSGDCPLWLAFLETITGGNAELVTYLQRVAGYCLTGVVSEHALFFLYGTGANGKSVFLTTLSSVIGDYATVAPVEMLMSSQGDRHPTELAKLRGARLVTAVETEQGRRWAESKLKTLTGGDRITARFMNRDFFDYSPQFKLIVAGNHRPSIQNVDEALRRRVHLIPFTVTIPAGERDPVLAEKLIAEADGILAWAVAGCLQWQQIGLAPPDAVRLATEEYFESEDAVGRWFADCCEAKAGHKEPSSRLYASWRRWAEANGEVVGSMKNFTPSIASRGFKPYHDRKGRGLIGLCLRSQTTPADDR